jgi:hypothetical protein
MESGIVDVNKAYPSDAKCFNPDSDHLRVASYHRCQRGYDVKGAPAKRLKENRLLRWPSRGANDFGFEVVNKRRGVFGYADAFALRSSNTKKRRPRDAKGESRVGISSGTGCEPKRGAPNAIGRKALGPLCRFLAGLELPMYARTKHVARRCAWVGDSFRLSCPGWSSWSSLPWLRPLRPRTCL